MRQTLEVDPESITDLCKLAGAMIIYPDGPRLCAFLIDNDIVRLSLWNRIWLWLGKKILGSTELIWRFAENRVRGTCHQIIMLAGIYVTRRIEHNKIYRGSGISDQKINMLVSFLNSN